LPRISGRELMRALQRAGFDLLAPLDETDEEPAQ
jgi:hypothetical protein